jgi:deazaflavin-dependent oxidoreductase (nitroreductase family)
MSTTTTKQGRRSAIRTFNKKILNPLMLLAAGRRHWYAAKLHHIGRRSGRPYVTPVVAEPVPGGFVVPLPYGTDVDWLRNVRAAGEAVIDLHGIPYAVDQPQVVAAAEALPIVRPSRRRVWRRLGIEGFLRVRTMKGPG